MLKVRQLGISTFVALLFLDCCLFYRNFRCGVIDARIEDAKEKLEKMRLGWELLDFVPEGASDGEVLLAALMRERKRCLGVVKAGVVLPAKKTETMMGFANGSKVSVDVSFRGGTLQGLHVSELAKISKLFPIRAREIVSGAFEAVPESGFIVVESTHEGGKFGENYEIVKSAMENESKSLLSWQDFKFHFFSWLDHPEYRMVPVGPLKDATVEYFDDLRERYGLEVSVEQMAWWEGKEATHHFRVRQEYPSVPDEAFNAIGNDAFYGAAFTRLRTQGRVGSRFVVDRFLPVYCSWDFGVRDMGALVFFQPVGGEVRVVWGYQANKMELPHYVEVVREFEREHGVRVYRHFVPHDAVRHDDLMVTRQRRLEEAGLEVRVVPRCQSVFASINEVRAFLPTTIWHERCGEELANGQPGVLNCLESYHAKPNGDVDHDASSHLADAFRMFVEAACAGLVENVASGIVGAGEGWRREGGGCVMADMP